MQGAALEGPPTENDLLESLSRLSRGGELTDLTYSDLGSVLDELHPIFAKFVVIDVPPTNDRIPRRIREQWVGMSLPVRAVSSNGIPVIAAEAIARLQVQEEGAAEWWDNYLDRKAHEYAKASQEIFLPKFVSAPRLSVRKRTAFVTSLVFSPESGLLVSVNDNRNTKK